MRLKIIAGNLAIVILLGLASFSVVRGQLEASLVAGLEARVASDREVVERMLRLAALEFIDLVTQRATERQLRDVFAGLDETSRRTRAYEAAESTAVWLTDPARGDRGGPDIVVIVDDRGKAIARNGARNVMFGVDLSTQLPALQAALRDGIPRHDAWMEPAENKLMQAAVAPIRGDSGAVLGALVVGYDFSNGVAARHERMVGRDVGFVIEGKVYSSSLAGSGVRDLQAALFGPQAAATRAVLAGQIHASQPFRAALDGSDYSGVTGLVPLAPSHPVGFVVLGNRTEQLAAAGVVQIILMLTVLGAVLVVLYGFMIGSAILRPIEQIEEGVLAVINGQTDLRLETASAELGGLAFRINQLINVLTGTEERAEDEQGRPITLPPASGAGWKDAAFGDGAAAGGAAGASGGAGAGADDPIDDPALSARLAAEDEAAYKSRVYKEYAAAKQAAGESVASISEERFHQRLDGRGTALVQKHGCRLVRFQVETRGDQVLLRPVLIR